MKKSLFILFAALSVSAASAQQVDSKQPTSKQVPTAEQMAKIQADRMRHQLLLGNDQYDKVYKLCLKRAQRQIARMQEIKKEQAQMSADMKKILNEAQYERYEQQRNQPRVMRGGQYRGKMPQRGFCPMQRNMGGLFNPYVQGQSRAQRSQLQPQMQMPAKEFQKGGQIPLDVQGNRRRPAMYDDTRKLENTSVEAKSTEAKELK